MGNPGSMVLMMTLSAGVLRRQTRCLNDRRQIGTMVDTEPIARFQF